MVGAGPFRRSAAAFDRRLLAPAPAERLAVLRVLVGGFTLGWLLVRLPHLVRVLRFDDDRFDPVGPLGLLTSPLGRWVGVAVLVAALLSGVGFVAGWRWRVNGPLFATAFLVVTTYRSSWGQLFHTENLAALHLIVLACSPAAAVLSVDAARRGPVGTSPRADDEVTERSPAAPRYGIPVRLMALITVLAYFVSGWAKVRNGGLDWVTGDVLRNHIAHDNLRKILFGDAHAALGAAAVGHRWIFPPMAFFSLVVELAAPLVLLGRRVRYWWSGAAWMFHVGIFALMAISFPYQLLGLAFAPLLPVERLAERSTWRPRRRRSPRPQSSRRVAPEV